MTSRVEMCPWESGDTFCSLPTGCWNSCHRPNIGTILCFEKHHVNYYHPVLLCSSLVTSHVTIIIQDKDTNPKSFLVLLREPENVLNFIYHYCQLVLLIKSTHIVLMVSQMILNSTCWPAMKIAVKFETATYAPALKLACLSSALLFI